MAESHPGSTDKRVVNYASVYARLRAIGRRLMAAERAGHTLTATALVHEAYARLGPAAEQVTSRNHLVALATRVMRRILVDRARAKAAAKRGGELERVDFHGLEVAGPHPEFDAVAVDEALEKLHAIKPKAAEVASHIVFGGLSQPEVAEAMGLHVNTVGKHWQEARRVLAGQLGGPPYRT